MFSPKLKIVFMYFIITLFLTTTLTAQKNFFLNNPEPAVKHFIGKSSNSLNTKSPLNQFSGLSSFNTESSTNPDIKIYSGFGDNIINSFKGNNLYLHLAGALSTGLLVATNTDYYVHKFFNENEKFGVAARPVIRPAKYFPFVISGSLFLYGKLNPDKEAVAASYAVLQSTVIAFAYNSLLKAITGRAHPDWRNGYDMKELSKEFKFGFWRGGIFWGWPSGHTSSTIAVISSLTSFYPEKTWLKAVGYSYAAYMMFAVSSLNRGGMHWFSDAIAAAFMSYAIGSTVGKYFRSRFEGITNTQNNPVSLTPGFPLLNFNIQF